MQQSKSISKGIAKQKAKAKDQQSKATQSTAKQSF
jgi:hypothetical protein